jgi:hypothetical protein
VLHRLELSSGVVLGDPDEEAGEHQADDRRAPQVPHREQLLARADVEGHLSQHVAHDDMRNRPERDEREDARHPQPAVERRHHVHLAGLRPHEPGADDRGDDGEAAERERINQRRRGSRLHHERAEQHGGDDGHGIGLEEVGGHAGAVADVVAHVVGDHRRVARIVLGDAGFDLADEVGADVGALGEDAAAQSREDRDERAAEAEPDERMDDVREVRLVDRVGIENREVAGDAEEPQPHHQQAGNGAAGERDLQRLIEAHARGFGRAHAQPRFRACGDCRRAGARRV